MPDETSWIGRELRRVFPQADLNQGIDLDRNGAVEGPESLADLGADGTVDEQDWRLFYARNLETVRRQVSFFEWGAGFSPDNPIHDLFSIESEIFDAAAIRAAYAQMTGILTAVRNNISPNDPPEVKIRDAYRLLGISITSEENVTLTGGLLRSRLDCDTGSYVFLALAHELGWPLYAVMVPGHVFLRWDDGTGDRFNIDFTLLSQFGTFVMPDQFYGDTAFLSQQSIEQGVFLRSLTRRELIGTFFLNRAIFYSDAGRPEEAIADNYRAIGTGLNIPLIHLNLAYALGRLNRHQEAIGHLDQAIAMDPHCLLAFFKRGSAKTRLGRYEEAIGDFDRFEDLLNRFRAISHQLDLPAFGVLPVDVYANVLNRGFAKLELGRFAEAIPDFRRAIEIDPAIPNPYFGLAKAYVGLRRLAEALPFYNEAIRRNPIEGGYFFYRGKTYLELGRFSEALNDLERAWELNFREEGIEGYMARARREVSRIEASLPPPPPRPDPGPPPAWEGQVFLSVGGKRGDPTGGYAVGFGHLLRPRLRNFGYGLAVSNRFGEGALDMAVEGSLRFWMNNSTALWPVLRAGMGFRQDEIEPILDAGAVLVFNPAPDDPFGPQFFAGFFPLSAPSPDLTRWRMELGMRGRLSAVTYRPLPRPHR